jgi:hypothetical protein
VPGDDSLLDQPDAAGQIACCDPLPATATDVAEGGVAAQQACDYRALLGVAQYRTQGVERSGHGDRVKLANAENGLPLRGEIGRSRRRPLRHQ